MNTLARRLFAGTAVAVLSAGLFTAAFAQEGAAPAGNPAAKPARVGRGHRQHAMFKELNLTEDQKAKLKTLRASLKPRREAVLNNSTLSETEKKQQLQALRKELREKTLEVLTPEQREKLKAHRAEMKTKRGAK